MNTINDRISYLINSENLKKTQFAERVGLSQAYVSQICGGVRTPSDRLIADICREFHIRREWLENGEEPMKYPEADTDMAVISDLLADTDDPVAAYIKAIYKVYKELPPEDQEVLRRFIKSLRDTQ